MCTAVRDIQSRQLACSGRIGGSAQVLCGGSLRRMMQNVTGRLRAQIAQAELDADAAQLDVAFRLDDLAARLEAWQPHRPRLLSLFANNGPAPRGLYIYGAVGRGKTMLADLFFD